MRLILSRKATGEVETLQTVFEEELMARERSYNGQSKLFPQQSRYYFLFPVCLLQQLLYCQGLVQLVPVVVAIVSNLILKLIVLL